MRLFVAAPVSEETKIYCRGIIARLGAAGADFKWVEPQNLHLTLAFLGDRDEKDAPLILKAMEESKKPAFRVIFDHLGAFDSWQRPRVIWIGAGEGASELSRLARTLEESLRARGMELDRKKPFAAHLTLGRMRGPGKLSRLRARVEAEGKLPPLDCLVNRIILYRSHLSSSGPRYEELARVFLD